MMRKALKNIEHTGRVILILVFMLLLIFPTVQQFYPIIPKEESTEQRQPAPKPELKLTYLDGFPGKYEKYYNDHFSLRNHFVKWKSELSTNVFGQTPFPDKVISGKQGWLYMVKNELATYRGTNIYTQSVIDSIVGEFEYRKKYLEKMNSAMYLVILPTKYTIYPEYLPNYVDRLSQLTRTDQIVQALQNKGINLIDLRNPMKKAKDKGKLYYKTDNHWNALGSFFAYQYIIEKLRQDYPSIPQPRRLSDYTISREESKGLNLARMLSMESSMKDSILILTPDFKQKTHSIPKFGFKSPPKFIFDNIYEQDFTTGIDSFPNCLFVRDSYGNSIIPYLTENFDTTVCIFDDWKYKLDPFIVQTVKPNIVIYAILESLWDEFLMGLRMEFKTDHHLYLQKHQ